MGVVQRTVCLAILALLIGCGLRRSEIVSLRVDNVQQRDVRWVLADVLGKGNRVRTVPAPSWVKVAIDVWMDAGVIREARLLRAINKHVLVPAVCSGLFSNRD